MRSTRRAYLLIAAALLVSALVAAPAADAAAKKRAAIQVQADPKAPSGHTPLPIFTVVNAHKGWTYWLSAVQVAGSSQYCVPNVGSVLGKIASGGKVEFDPRPDYFETQPYLVEDTYDVYAPCKGLYEGELREKQPGKRAKTVRDFRLKVPSMDLEYTR